MRITQVLLRQNYHKVVKRIWKEKSNIQVAPLEISPELRELGVKIHDALDVVKEANKSHTDTTALMVPEDYSISAKRIYLFNDKVRVSEKEAQVLCLTKTVSYSGLPPILNSLMELEQIPNQDELVQHYITQAFIKDSQLVKLPRKIDLQKPGHVFPREYGIRYKRKSSSLVYKLSFLCEMGCSKYPASFSRSKILDAFSEVVVEKENDTIVCQIPADILFTSEKPLTPFATPSEVAATKDIALPSIYPVKPTLDLEKCEISPAKHINDISILDSVKPVPRHVHTLHVIHKSFGFWFPVQKLSRAIVACFTYAAQEARRIHGDDVKELPEPITIQCVHSDLQTMGFLAYQLNTLDFSSDQGIKNQVWIEDPQDLCTLVCGENHVWQTFGIKDYNDKVFPKMLAMYLNGAHPVSL